VAGAEFAHELEGIFWNSSLRALPDASGWAVSASGVFAALQQSFGFQRPSAKNQFEHLLSLWRSQCAVVADRASEPMASSGSAGSNDSAVNEQMLLKSGLDDLHRELLAGFKQYRSQVRDHEQMRDQVEDVAAGRPSHGSVSCLEGRWPAPPELGEQMVELAAFLLVWGEAGNARFMPELICFLTDLVLTAEDSGGRSLYSNAPLARSGAFLARIIRPIYRTIFDETYEKVVVDKKTGKDTKVLHRGFDKFLPADCANYDDWNELFCDPSRLVDKLVLCDGTRLFALPRGARFSALERMDWGASLHRVKTHREVHSLWGLFAATHRIVFLHELLYLTTLVAVSSDSLESAQGGILLAGGSLPVCLAAVGLLVPFHVLCWRTAVLFTSGSAVRPHLRGGASSWSSRMLVVLKGMAWTLLCLLPVVTYVAVRFVEVNGDEAFQRILPWLDAKVIIGVHYFVCLCGALTILCIPGSCTSEAWKLTPVSCPSTIMRWSFWILVLGVKVWAGLQTVGALSRAIEELKICRLGREDVRDFEHYAFAPTWDRDVIEWLILVCIGFVLYVADTQFWFTLGCSALGVLVALQQRRCRLFDFAIADLVAKIPERFSKKVLCYEALQSERRFSLSFPILWDKVIEYMRYEDKIDDYLGGELSFFSGGRDQVDWKVVQQPLSQPSLAAAVRSGGPVGRATALRVRLPHVFHPASCWDRLIRRGMGFCRDPTWPANTEVQWRLSALSRALTLPMPRPFRPPYIPGLTVLIPHYGESILVEKQDLYKERLGEEEVVPLMSWLEYRYEEEFRAFTSRMSHLNSSWTRAGTAWSEYTSQDWDKLCAWASMRCQTLWRTVAGMTLYHQALDCLHRLQGDRGCAMGQRDVWKVSEVFTCMVSMQMYPFFTPVQLEHTNRMLEKFPESLKIAFIDFEDKCPDAELDGVHPRQQRRYFSCLIDKACACDASGKREPRLRIELPGFPILGDGKGDNQNHALPFTRGLFIQAIDSNQGAYFEQMLLLPNVLGEFRAGSDSARAGSYKIVGFPEHITSDIGTIGDFAAGAETAFGTILQRSYAALGARMHYGHPDMMNKALMMQQGGVSKATKTVNLSEDIFAGMDFTLRGGGRRIQHSEYFHVSKGRDLGFNTVLLFFSKLSAGTGEQLLTRQMLRLGERLGLPEFLTFYYAHGGFYLTQFLLSKCSQLLVFMWLLVVLDAPESNFESMDPRVLAAGSDGPSVMARLLIAQYGWIFLLFLVAGSAPLLLETCIQEGAVAGIARLVTQMCTLAPLHFVFQAKIIGAYISNEILYGGASYVSTGRGLPTERRFFIGIKGKSSGIYNDFAQHAFYDGARLLVSMVIALLAGGLNISSELQQALFWWCIALAMTVTSWLFAPFVFNPYQFACGKFRADLRDWWVFFFSQSDPPWHAWYEEVHLKPGSGARASPCVVIAWVLFLASWYTVLLSKLHILTIVFSSSINAFVVQILSVLPPILVSGFFCLVAPPLLSRLGRRLPLSVAASVVVLSDCLEALPVLYILASNGWWKSAVIATVLKYAFLSALLALCECFFRLRSKESAAALSGVQRAAWEAMELWLLAHRMARDILVSFLIFSVLSAGMFMDWLRTSCCGCRCSPHNLLVYRDPGHPTHASEEIGHSNDARLASFLAPSMYSSGNDRHRPLSQSTTLPGAGVLPPPPQRLPQPTVRGAQGAQDSFTLAPEDVVAMARAASAATAKPQQPEMPSRQPPLGAPPSWLPRGRGAASNVTASSASAAREVVGSSSSEEDLLSASGVVALARAAAPQNPRGPVV